MSNSELYQQNIIDHYKNPSNKGELDPCDASQHKTNQYCGDELTLYARTKEGALTDVTFMGEGCAISTAGASMLTNRLIGMTLEEAKALTEDDVYEMFGVTIGPSRAKCALLAYGALQDMLGNIE